MQGIIGNNIIKLDAVDSTNTYAATLLKNQKHPEGLVITAIYQTSGRGQMGTIWHSAPGESLTFSVILMPTFLKVEQQFLLSMAISLGLVEYLKIKSVTNGIIKWPNDVLVNRKKIAGILIENSLKGNQMTHSVVGIGVNINSGIIGLPETATSLQLETGRHYDLEAELYEICHHLNKYYLMLRTGKFSSIKTAYMEHLLGFHSPVELVKNQVKTVAKVKQVEDNGSILLEDLSGKKFIAGFKEYEWLY